MGTRLVCVLVTATLATGLSMPRVAADDAATLEVSASADRQLRYVEGEIIVKLDTGAVPVQPSAGAEGARAAASASTLGVAAKEAFLDIVTRYGLTFDRPLTPALDRSSPSRRSTAPPADWQEHVEDVRRRFPTRAARAPEGSQAPDLSNVYLVRVENPSQTREAAEALTADPHVVYAHPNYHVELYSTPLPNVSFVPNDFYVTANGVTWREGSWGQSFPDLWGLTRMQALEAWDLFADPETDPGDGVVVAVVDTGIDYTHPDINDNVWVNPGEDLNHNGVIDGTNLCPTPNGDYNCVDDDGNGFVDDLRGWDFVSSDNDPKDDHFHGTHVSGTIAAEVNQSIGIAGVAPNARILAAKALDAGGNGDCADAVEALMYVTDLGADVINNSWGISAFACPEVADAVLYAHSQGAVVVVAAGNSSRNASTALPAAASEAISVAAFNQNDERTFFTNFGSLIDVAAPGGGAGDNSDPSVRAILSLQASLPGTPGGCLNVAPGYCRTSGTSMASPHVAGLAAAVLSADPSLTVEQVRQTITRAADDVAAAGWDAEAGFGRANALGAVDAALTTASPSAAFLTSMHEKSLYGDVPILGSVGPAGTTLTHWTLSYRPEAGGSYHTIGSTSMPGAGPFSTNWDVRSLAPGSYLLRLQTQANDGSIGEDIQRFYRSFYQNASEKLPVSAHHNKAIRAGDVDGDGDRDLFLCNFQSFGQQQLWINDGSGNFTDESASRLPAASTFACWNGHLVDIDGDADLDITMLRSVGSVSSFVVWINQGNGSYVDESATRAPALPGSDTLGLSTAAGDFDGDLDVDFFVTTSPAALLINNGAGFFTNQANTRIPWLTSCSICFAHAADLDRDGDVDIAYGEGIARNNGSGVFTLVQSFSFGSLGFSVGDLNSDKYPDIVASSNLYLNTGTGTFSSPQSLLSDPCFVFSHLVDMNLDGTLDVLLTTLTNALTLCRQQNVVLRNDGSASFTDVTDETWGNLPNFAAYSVFADLTGEGYPELVLANASEPAQLLVPRWDELPPACVGDCDGNGTMTVGELQRVSNIRLGTQPITDCREGDADADARISYPEVLLADFNFFNDCEGADVGGLAVDLGTGIVAAAPGGTATVPISMAGGVGSVASLQIDILYDPTWLEIDPVTDCTLGAAINPQKHGIRGYVPAGPPAGPGLARMRVEITPLSLSFPMPTFGDGVVASCAFAVDAGAPLGPISPLLADLVATGGSNAEVFSTFRMDGLITLGCGSCGC